MLPSLTWSSSGFVWSAWNKGHCCHFHTILPLLVSPVNCHPSFQWNLIVFLGNLYPWWGRRCWQKFHWAERWGRHSQSFLDRHLGMRARTGFHLNLSSFHHMLGAAPRCYIQFWILFYSQCSTVQPDLSGIWNDFNEMIEFVIMSWLRNYFFSLHPQMVLAGLVESRDLITT